MRGPSLPRGQGRVRSSMTLSSLVPPPRSRGGLSGLCCPWLALRGLGPEAVRRSAVDAHLSEPVPSPFRPSSSASSPSALVVVGVVSGGRVGREDEQSWLSFVELCATSDGVSVLLYLACESREQESSLRREHDEDKGAQLFGSSAGALTPRPRSLGSYGGISLPGRDELKLSVPTRRAPDDQEAAVAEEELVEEELAEQLEGKDGLLSLVRSR